MGEPSWLRDPTLRAELALVDARMSAAADDADDLTAQAATHLMDAGGKRLRAVLTLLAARCGGEAREHAVAAAAAVELMHLASLHHDDVVDQAAERRGTASVNHRWGNQVATFAGGYLLARAIGLFAALGGDVNVLASDVLARLWRGQMMEVEGIFQLDVDEQHRLDIAIDKTAALYELPCRVGARVARARRVIEHDLAAYGRSLGIAFQIVDDALDIVAPAADLGKAPGADLREGVYTLPVILTLSGRFAGGEQLRAIVSLREAGDAEIEQALRLLATNGSVEEALRTARHHADAAKSALSRIEDTAAAEALSAIADFVVDRPAGLERSPW